MRTGPPTGALLVLAAFGCGEAGRTALPGVERADSAGIEIVTVSTPLDRFGPIAVLSDQPELEIGSVSGDGPDAFGAITGVRQLPDGSILAVDVQAREIRRFDSEGRHLGTIGRRGEGPGEFESLLIAGAASDTIWVLDRSLRRMTLFHPQGELITSYPATLAGGRLAPQRIDVLRDRTLLALEQKPVPRPPFQNDGSYLRRDTMVLSRFGPDGSLLGTVTVSPGEEDLVTLTCAVGGGCGVRVGSPPFRRTFAHTSYSGGIVGGMNDTFQLFWWTTEGRAHTHYPLRLLRSAAHGAGCHREARVALGPPGHSGAAPDDGGGLRGRPHALAPAHLRGAPVGRWR